MSRYAESNWREYLSHEVMGWGDDVTATLEVGDLEDLRTGQLYPDGAMRVSAVITNSSDDTKVGKVHTRKKVYRGDYRDHAKEHYTDLIYRIQREAH